MTALLWWLTWLRDLASAAIDIAWVACIQDKPHPDNWAQQESRKHRPGYQEDK